MKKVEKVESPDIKRINVALSRELMTQLNDWRRQQEDVPNASESVRRLLESSLGRKAK